IINDILDFSRIEADRLELQSTPFSLRERLGETVKLLAVQAQQKGLHLTCHVAEDVPDPLRGDPGRLRQVWTNLIGNAIKFTDGGEVRVEVDRLREDPISDPSPCPSPPGSGVTERAACGSQ